MEYLKSAYRGHNRWTPKLRKIWARWQQNCQWELLNQEERAIQKQKFEIDIGMFIYCFRVYTTYENG